MGTHSHSLPGGQPSRIETQGRDAVAGTQKGKPVERPAASTSLPPGNTPTAVAIARAVLAGLNVDAVHPAIAQALGAEAAVREILAYVHEFASGASDEDLRAEIDGLFRETNR